MECQRARELYVGTLGLGEAADEGAGHHLASCQTCQGEVRGLEAAWEALAALPPLQPTPAVARTLARRVHRASVREALVATDAWRQAALAGVAGFAISLLLSLLVPYETMVALCQRLVPLTPTAGYLVAGVLYGLLPMSIGALLQSRTAPAGVRGLEAAVVFMVVLTPYVLLRCAGFPAAFLAGFVGGIAVGAAAGSTAAIRLRAELSGVVHR